MPGVIGCIDCTHIAITRPVEEEHTFFNRKGYHSLNVQMVSCWINSNHNTYKLMWVTNFPETMYLKINNSL